MMDLGTIRSINRTVAWHAARAKKLPLVFEDGDERAKVNSKLPFFGDYVPKGWKRVNIAKEIGDLDRGLYTGDAQGFGAYFVDLTGEGRAYEPALTQAEFAKVLKPGYGYATIESGQMQEKVGVFKRKQTRARRGLTDGQIAMLHDSKY